MNKELRNMPSEINYNEGRHISAYCIKFNQDSNDMGFIERILPEAVTEETLKRSDVMCLWNHDSDKVLGRCRYGIGNLKLTIDERGVKYDLDLLDNSIGDMVLSYIRSGIVEGSSFAFTLEDTDDAQTWERRSDGKLYRTIKKIDRIWDCSPVLEPAYSKTEVSCRSLDKFLEDEQKSKELKEKYNKLRDEINNY